MRDVILNFPKQFLYQPVVHGNFQFSNFSTYLIIGMGGSHLAADLLKNYSPSWNILVHKSYGLPDIEKEILRRSLVVLSSYSGDTEEVLDAFESAYSKKLSFVVITTGGRLLEMARSFEIPFIQLPNDDNIQPRFSLGFQSKALLFLMNKEKELKEITQLAESLAPGAIEKEGKTLAQKINNKIPIVYSSENNLALAYNWKIKFNETSKIPAFFNSFPELNHNEMAGFSQNGVLKSFAQIFHFIFLYDENDDWRIQRRMQILKKLYEERHLSVELINLTGQNKFHKIFTALIMADWVSYYMAQHNNVDPEKVLLIEQFKKILKSDDKG
jgi:glucose/mannose-6-phosphate isomerase